MGECGRVDLQDHLTNLGDPGGIEVSVNFQKLLKDWLFGGI